MIRFIKRLLGSAEPAGRARGPRKRSATADVLANGPRPAEPGPRGPASDGSDFDPYNTGRFDRGASWERVRRSHR